MRSKLIQPLENRLTSIDALRGFTMFFIIGGERIFTNIYQVWPNSITETLAKNMEHAEWEGLACGLIALKWLFLYFLFTRKIFLKA